MLRQISQETDNASEKKEDFISTALCDGISYVNNFARSASI